MWITDTPHCHQCPAESNVAGLRVEIGDCNEAVWGDPMGQKLLGKSIRLPFPSDQRTKGAEQHIENAEDYPSPLISAHIPLVMAEKLNVVITFRVSQGGGPQLSPKNE